MKIEILPRVVARSLKFLGFITASILHQTVAQLMVPEKRRRRLAAEWLQRTAEGCRRILHLHPEAFGAVPRTGLLVANHLSYLDIILLASLRPCVFVSKKEVRSWPIFGTCAMLGGTIFVDRTRRGAVAAVSDQMRAALADGLLLVLFPEGTSSGGSSVLPFKSALIEPALRLGCPITAGAITYELDAGSVPDEICYWRDMTLLPHLLNVFAKPGIRASLRCGMARPRSGERKMVARELHREVAALHAFGREPSTGDFRGSPSQPLDQFAPVIGDGVPAAAESEHA